MSKKPELIILIGEPKTGKTVWRDRFITGAADEGKIWRWMSNTRLASIEDVLQRRMEWTGVIVDPDGWAPLEHFLPLTKRYDVTFKLFVREDHDI